VSTFDAPDQRQGVPEGDDEPARYVMRRLINDLMNPGAKRSQEEQDQLVADRKLSDTISHERLPLPAVLGKFPEKAEDQLDKATTEWLNAVLDVEMRWDLYHAEMDYCNEVAFWAEKEHEDFNRELWDEEFTLWNDAIRQADGKNYKNGKDQPKSDDKLIELLRDPRVVIDQWVRDYLAERLNRLKRRGPGNPGKSHGQRVEDDDENLCWAERDATRLNRLLLELYPDAPQRATGNRPSIPKVAEEIAAERWGIEPDKLHEFKRKSRNRRAHLP
jgi:hypothetical protein